MQNLDINFDVPKTKEEIIEALKKEYETYQKKGWLTKTESNNKNLVKKILDQSQNENVNIDDLLNLYIEYQYQIKKRQCKTPDDRKALNGKYQEINTAKKRKKVEEEGKRNKFAEGLKRIPEIEIAKKMQIEKFYAKYPDVQKEIPQTNYLKDWNCKWKIEVYPKRIEILDYCEKESKLKTKAEVLGKLKVKIQNKQNQKYGKQIVPFDIVQVEKKEEDGVTNNYVVLMDVPKKEEVELKVQDGKVEKLGVTTKNPIPIKENQQHIYAEKLFSYAMLENTKNNYAYLGQEHKVLKKKDNIQDGDTIDGLMKEILSKVSKKGGTYQVLGNNNTEKIASFKDALDKIMRGELYARKKTEKNK